MATKNIPTMIYLTPEQKKAMAQLSKTTRVPATVYFREAVDDLLKKYKRQAKPRTAK